MAGGVAEYELQCSELNFVPSLSYLHCLCRKSHGERTIKDVVKCTFAQSEKCGQGLNTSRTLCLLLTDIIVGSGSLVCIQEMKGLIYQP